MPRLDLAELELGEMEQALADRGYPRYHAGQIYRWIYRRAETDVARMTDLGKAMRAALGEEFTVLTPTIVGDEVSTDGTRKLLLELHDGRRIESVFIPDRKSVV